MGISRSALFVALAASMATAFGGCAQLCRITTDPEGAEIKINGVYYGQTPCPFKYRSGLPDTYILEIRKDGYEEMKNASVDRVYRADVSLFLLLAAIVPYFFSARLEDSYEFKLQAKGTP
jgi:hypothetical protein